MKRLENIFNVIWECYSCATFIPHHQLSFLLTGVGIRRTLGPIALKMCEDRYIKDIRKANFGPWKQIRALKFFMLEPKRPFETFGLFRPLLIDMIMAKSSLSEHCFLLSITVLREAFHGALNIPLLSSPSQIRIVFLMFSSRSDK